MRACPCRGRTLGGWPRWGDDDGASGRGGVMGRRAVVFVGCVLVATVLAMVPGTERRGEAAPSPQLTVYVTPFDGGTMVPIDVATNTTGTPLAVGADPAAVAITPNGATAYVANVFRHTVTP